MAENGKPNSKALATASDERLVKSSDDQRQSRAANTDRSHEGDGLATSAEERRRMFRNEWEHVVLPQPPEIPGWHVCWLTTNSTYDPLARRLRLGYALVKEDEVPEWTNDAVQSMHNAEYPGCITVNEMILGKIPMERYQQYMREFHHNMPLEEERSIREGARQLSDENRDSRGKELVRLESGMEDLGRHVSPPRHFQ